jgi:uncharacterized protein (TIGR00251 family)
VSGPPREGGAPRCGAAFLEERRGALYLRVRAAPGASREGIAGVHGQALKVAVSAPPERGKANRAITRVLAGALGLRPGQVALATGESSRDKTFRIDGLTSERAAAILGALVAAAGEVSRGPPGRPARRKEARR